jgi:UPF0271 protein
MLIDLNCDMGEGIGNDELIMPYISSANIACGYHAGDETTMNRTVESAIKNNVSIGAHPSFFDRENFGRSDFHIPFDDIYTLVIKQVNLLKEITEKHGAFLHHVKPHGALYNMSARTKKIAAVIALAVKDSGEDLILYGLSGSHSIREAKAIGVKTASEVFADRTYLDDGKLTPRSQPDSLIDDVNKSIAQVLQMIKEGTVKTVSGKIIPIKAETVCIHSDGNYALELVKAINQELIKHKIAIKEK